MVTYDTENIFAKILRGVLPAHKVYEDDHSLAIMDIMPQTEGHTLVIPKAECENLFDIPTLSLQQTIATTQRVARAVKEAFAAEGIMIAQLNGSTAGQSVFHLHFHILTRNSGIDIDLHTRTQVENELLAEHAKRIRAALSTIEQEGR